MKQQPSFQYIRNINYERWILNKELRKINRKIECAKHNLRVCKTLASNKNISKLPLLNIIKEINYYNNNLKNCESLKNTYLDNLGMLKTCISWYTCQY